MKIALVGYGNMGKEIDALVSVSKTDEIVSRSFSENQKKLDLLGIGQADVVIDFTSPEIVMENIKTLAAMKKQLVIGTTGWYDKLTDVQALSKKYHIGIVYGGNFSIGANIYFKILALSAKLLSKFDFYDVYGFEIHHRGKKDSPSGTAKKISQIVLENFPQKTIVQNEQLKRSIRKEEFHLVSIRGGENAGRHEIIFDSLPDEIILTHQAHNRKGFAQGALLAAKFIQNRKGFFRFDEVFDKEIGGI